ncbi:hypothetical protein MWN52_02820 [Pseudoxanthomonas winnipegensis]|uniref:sulfotransferase family protein n=1 Tax=Pseudoxanthomonas winnipegensis TaxID=2480810 RepID=UPI0025783655|nr:hypothetical protein [Pseudoxanthomonas winnipegensis]WJI16256.1 hypothetical protein MWN52_02820 [Pseudoxanthomonas winnipegensis]
MTDQHPLSHGVFVLGMHRSGTSALTRVLNLLGLHLGDNLLGAREGNLSGHWEPLPVIEINERLLAMLGRTWSDPREMESNWLQNAAVRSLLPEAELLLKNDYVRHPRWSIKDPRISRLLPFWLKAAGAHRGVALSAVIAVRHPWEVASSLNRRDGLPLSQGLLLWWEHLSEALRHSRGMKRVVVNYTALLHDWPTQVSRISKALDFSLQVRSDQAAEDSIETFLDRGARHEVHDGAEHPIPVALQLFYEALCAATTEDDLLALEHTALRINEASDCHTHALTDIYVHKERLHKRVTELEVAAATASIADNKERDTDLVREIQSISHHLSHADWVNTELEKKCREAERALDVVKGAQAEQAERNNLLAGEVERLQGELRHVHAEKEKLHEEIKSLYAESRIQALKNEQLSAERDALSQTWYVRLGQILNRKGK